MINKQQIRYYQDTIDNFILNERELKKEIKNLKDIVDILISQQTTIIKNSINAIKKRESKISSLQEDILDLKYLLKRERELDEFKQYYEFYEKYD